MPDTPEMKNERLAAKQARGLHSPVGPRPAAAAREQLHPDMPYEDHRAILEHQMEKRQGRWLQRSQEAQGRALRQMSPQATRKPTRGSRP